MTACQDAHAAGCELCQSQLAAPRPFHPDLCHFDIRPGDGWGNDPVAQCPHLAVPGHPSLLCEHHLEAARRDWATITARTAPFN